ncbi:conserved exported hypothetical protein [Microbacterium sp. 8M]|uniref:hypothetical protein n=1 Tax=Microbacterium sp. 8M TaxID=2653153 RepID=UPI0012F2628A|nr:hypothetical protein [Microbacterium sp. 8M]VXC27444.1 conserved exported hypothetical protein [Microbacterium sp. 8M]
MTTKTFISKLSGALALGVALAGAGTGAAMAATPSPSPAGSSATVTPAGKGVPPAMTKTAGSANAKAQDFSTTPPGAYTMSQVTNDTPYTWTLTQFSTEYYWTGPWIVAPPKTLAPGQTAQWVPNYSPYGQSGTDYRFVDASGQTHDMYVVDKPNDYKSYSLDRASDGAWTESGSYHMQGDPDHLPNHADAIWNSPTSITIDANKDPADATAIVNSELPRVAASSVSWTPVSTTPTFQQIDQQQISSTVENYSSAPATLGVSRSTSVGESTTIGEALTYSESSNVFGFVGKFAASVTGDQSWGDTDSVQISQSAPIKPGQSGYVYRDLTVASLTGTLKFTTPEGTTFTIENVSISRGDIVDPHGTRHTGMDVSATETAAPPLTAAH